VFHEASKPGEPPPTLVNVVIWLRRERGSKEFPGPEALIMAVLNCRKTA
jgi:hypothetical protein